MQLWNTMSHIQQPSPLSIGLWESNTGKGLHAGHSYYVLEIPASLSTLDSLFVYPM